MNDPSRQAVPVISAEKRRIAMENFERARQVMQTGNHEYAIQLLRICCQLDPGNFQFRQTLRRAQKERFDNNLRGSRFAFLTTPRSKARLKSAKSRGDYLAALEYAEDVLTKNPWDLGTQMEMAEAFDALGLTDLAVYTLDQARSKYPKDPTLNRALARLFEKRGDFQKAIVLWRIVEKSDPKDVEAAHKSKDLAASETIARGGYEAAVAGTKESPIVGRMETQAWEKRDRLSRETDALQKRIEAAPTEPTLYVQLATLFRKHGQTERARAALQQGLGPTANHFALQIELLELDLLPIRDNIDRAEGRLRAARDNPNDDTGEMTVDDLTRLRGKLQRELAAREAELFRLKTERFPNDLTHQYELGLRLIKLDKVEEAIAELQQARRDERLKGKASMYLGICFRKRNNWRLAERNFEEALQSLPASDESSRKEVLYQLATGSAENGALPRAVDLGHELANIDYAYKNIGKLVDEWHLRQQQA